MNIDKNTIWLPCDSRSDLEARLTAREKRIPYRFFAEDASSWGYLDFGEFLIPVGYDHVGIEPQATLAADVLAVGASDTVLGLDPQTSEVVFEYRMPTTFHEFLHTDARGLLIKDETGFIWLSTRGDEQWKFILDDIVGQFSRCGETISGETFEGRPFSTRIPGFSQPRE